MIADAIEFVRKELCESLGVPDDAVIANSARKLIEDNNAPGAYISLINVQEEAALKNTPFTERRGDKTYYIEPPVHVNLYLLFAFEFQTYASSLVYLSRTIEFFQEKRWFDASRGTNFPASLEKLTFEMVSMTFEELNNLWGLLGGAYFPSVVYKLRLIRLQATTPAKPGPQITKTELEALVKK